MAKYFNRIRVDTPTGLTATLQSGGSLPVGTTYYYRVIAFRRYIPTGGPNMPVLSAPTTEVNATTDATNRTIQISWNSVTDAIGYYLQRTTTSGSYPVAGANTLRATSSSQILVYTGTSLADDGTFNWTGYNLDFTEEAPLIEVYSDASDTIESHEILNYALSQGWSNVRCPFPQGILSTTYSDVRRCMPVSYNGGLYIHDCKFRWRGIIIVINGIIYTAPTVEFINDSTDAIGLATFTIGWPYLSSDGKNTSTSFGCYNTIAGTGKLTSFVHRHIRSGSTVSSTYFNGCYFSSTGTYTLECGDMGHNVANWLSFANPTAVWTHLSGARVGGDKSDLIGLGSLYADTNSMLTNARWTPGYGIIYQFGYQLNTAYKDPVFVGTEGSQIVSAYIQSSGLNYVASVISYTVTFIVSTSSGTPIPNAKIEVTDAYGLPANFVTTNAYTVNSFNDTDTYTTLGVSNASELAVGDVVRARGDTEHMLVTNIAGSSVTFQRGYNSTTKKKKSGVGNLKFTKLANITTDSDGKATLVLNRSDYTNAAVANYVSNTLDWLVANGYFSRGIHTPHTIKVTATGHQTYQDVITVDKTLTLEIALRPSGTVFSNNVIEAPGMVLP